MAVLQDGSPSDYRGVLYNWSTDSTGQTAYSWDSTPIDYREPAKLTGTIEINGEEVTVDSQEAFTYYGGGTYAETTYQTEFNSMVESVAKYKGFYVGRYETGGFNTNKIVVKLGETGTRNSYGSINSINWVNWYKMYQMQKDFASSSASVASTMIWGCQWDQVMKFVNGKNDGIYDVKRGSLTRHTGELAATGSNINDKVQNIYDLEGNVEEWILEANGTESRVLRGSTYNNTSGNYAARRTDYKPYYSDFTIGSRVSLYIR